MEPDGPLPHPQKSLVCGGIGAKGGEAGREEKKGGHREDRKPSQKVGSALRLPKFLPTVIVSPVTTRSENIPLDMRTADAWRQRLDVRDPGEENDNGGEGWG